MARHKNIKWKLPANISEDWNCTYLAMLMDIRDELQELNNQLRQSRFCELRDDIKQINKRLAKKIKLK